jgi:eukaryotic-like serine/threonine-protein kinase
VPDEPRTVSRFTGYTLGGKYYLEEVIAEGGMGVVVAARHLVLGERVAVKLLRSSLFDRDDSARRFLREARAMARLRSDNIARVLDAGEGPSGAPYLVMELLSGDDLGTLLRRRGRLPPAEVCGWIAEACDGLREAHESGVIHRDLKPSNLFLATRPDGSRVVKVLDFGISKVADLPGEATLTTGDALLGSPPYMSPEQVREPHSVGASADIWSLGAILFRLLTGDHAFAETSTHELLVAVLRDEPRRLRAVWPEAPLRLERIVAGCMKREPSERYPTVAVLADELRAARRAVLSGAESSSSGAVPRADTARSTRSWWLRPALVGLVSSTAVLSILAISAFGGATDPPALSSFASVSTQPVAPLAPPRSASAVAVQRAVLSTGTVDAEDVAMPRESPPSNSATPTSLGGRRAAPGPGVGAPSSPIRRGDAYEDRL